MPSVNGHPYLYDKRQNFGREAVTCAGIMRLRWDGRLTIRPQIICWKRLYIRNGIVTHEMNVILNVLWNIVKLALRSRPRPYIQLGGLGSAVSFPSGVWGGAPADFNLVHFSLKIWQLVSTILMILLRINWLNFVQFSIQLDVLDIGLLW